MLMMTEEHRMCLRKHGTLVGRVLIGLLFIVTGWGFINTMGLTGMSGMMTNFGLPFGSLAAIIVLLLKFGGGLSLVTGYRVGLGAAALILFTICATWFGHIHQPTFDLVGTLKNLAIIGGLLYVAAYGAGDGWKIK